MINAALHGIVEEEEHCALGFVEAKLNREAGVFELARQIGQGLIEYVFGIRGAIVVTVLVFTCVCLALAGWGNVLQEVREVEFFPNRASRGFAFFSLYEPQIVSIPREWEW